MEEARDIQFQTMEPGEPLYFLAEFKRPFSEGAVIWWRPGAAGYTTDLKQAGAYTAKEAAEYEHHHTVAVPVDWVHSECRIRMSIDPGDSHKTPGVFWSADRLRAAVAPVRDR